MLKNATRRLARTFRSCMGAKRIMNANLGTEASQCGKFARFKEIHSDFKRDPNNHVAHLIRNIDGSRRQLDMVISSPFGTTSESGAQYVDRILKFIEQAKNQRQIFQSDIVFIPETQEYFQLKEELRYFVPFMFKYYIDKLENLIPMGVKNNKTKLNWNGHSTRTSNASNMGDTINNLPTLANNVSRKGSNITFASSIPNWKGGRKTRRHRHRR